eukprot:6204910-Pleurochrysis_carterae.AAC.8
MRYGYFETSSILHDHSNTEDTAGGTETWESRSEDSTNFDATTDLRFHRPHQESTTSVSKISTRRVHKLHAVRAANSQQLVYSNFINHSTPPMQATETTRRAPYRLITPQQKPFHRRRAKATGEHTDVGAASSNTEQQQPAVRRVGCWTRHGKSQRKERPRFGQPAGAPRKSQGAKEVDTQSEARGRT